jgi:type IV secretion system protein VirB10
MTDVKDPFLQDKNEPPFNGPGDDVNSNGKPQRNFKIYAIAVLGIFVCIAIFFPSLVSTTEKKQPVKPVEVTEAKLSKEMAAEEEKRPKAPVVPPPLPAAPESLKAPANDTSAADKALSRTLSIVGSPMETNEVVIGGESRGGRALSSVEKLLAETKATDGKLFANAEAMLKESLKAPPVAPTSSLSKEDAYLDKHGKDSFELPIAVRDAHVGHALYQGHVIRTVLLRGINSDLPGSILARVVSDVFDSVDGRIMLIPKGTVIYGDHSSEVSVGQTRMLVAADRMIFPNGKSASLQKSTVSDMTGYSGLEAKVDNHFFQMFGTSLLVGAASWLMPVADQSTTSTTNGGATTSGGSIVAQALGGTTKAIAERNRMIKPTLKVGQGELFLITIGRDLVLPEYK